MKSFLLPVGRSAGSCLPALLSALSCGAALPVSGLDILHITDSEPDPVIPLLAADLNRVHSLLEAPDNDTLFPSSFVFESCRPVLPSHQVISGDPASSVLLGALRGGKGGRPIPFGPAISLAAALMLLYGEGLVGWYLGLLGV